VNTGGDDMGQSVSNIRYANVSSNSDEALETTPRHKAKKSAHRGNKTTPGGKRFYKIAFIIHKWAGLFAATWLAILGFTGFFLTQDSKRGLQQAIVPSILTNKSLQMNAQRNATRLWQVDPHNSAYQLTGGARGLWWSSDGAAHWGNTSFETFGTPQILAIEPDPKHGWERIWIGTDEGIFSSQDKGLTAQKVSLDGQSITSIVAGSEPEEMLGVVDRNKIFRFNTNKPGNIEEIEISPLEKLSQPQEARLHKYLRSLHFGRGLFGADTSRLINQFGAVAMFTLCVTGLLYWGLPKLWMAQIKAGKSSDPHRKRQTIVWLFRLHGATFGILAAPIILYLAITGVIIGHDKELGWWMRGTRIKNEYFTPALKLSSWDGRIDAIIAYPGVPDSFSIGNHFGLFTTVDNGKTWARDEDAKGDAIGGASRIRRIGSRVFIMAGMGNTAISRDDDFTFKNYGVPDQMPMGMRQTTPMERTDTEIRMPRNHQPQEHDKMAPNHQSLDMAKMMETRFMPQDVTQVNGEFFWKSGDKLFTSGINGTKPMPISMTGPEIQGVPLWMWYRQIHTGMLFWSEWRWVNDLFGISAVFLVITGVIRWWRRKWI
jgi:hypothetical protein